MSRCSLSDPVLQIMGQKLGNLRPSHTEPASSPLLLHGNEVAVLPRSSSLAERLIPRCLKIEKDTEVEDSRRERLPTLEEWLRNSPGFEAQHRRQSPRVCPLNTALDRCQHLDSIDASPRVNSASDGRRLAVSSRDEQHGHGRAEAPPRRSFSRNESGRRRKVIFRLPEEGDIHVIPSHGDGEESVRVA